MGYFGTSIGDKRNNEWKKIIGTMPSVTEEQQAVNTPLSDYLAKALAGVGSQPTFEEWSETNVPDMFGGELESQAKSAYSQALLGEPVDYNPSGADFLQNVIPAIKESYVGTGAITGTEVGDRINREASVRAENIASIKASLYDAAKNRQATAATNYQQAWQQQLTIAYDNYVKLNPDASTILQAALSYLNIPLMGVYQKPVTS